MQSQNIGRRPRKSGDIPMRVRRRQSDARWRANVASCYETLKHVIPVNKRASRRQISKAQVLQETAKHINFLDNILFALLNEKANRDQMPNSTAWCSSRIDGIRRDFIDKQARKVAAMTCERKLKRCRYKPPDPSSLATGRNHCQQPAPRLSKRAPKKPRPVVARSPTFSPRTPSNISHLTAVRRRKAVGAAGARKKKAKSLDFQAVPIANKLEFQDGTLSPPQVTPQLLAPASAAAGYEASFQQFYLKRQSGQDVNLDPGFDALTAATTSTTRRRRKQQALRLDGDFQCVPDLTLSQTSKSDEATDASGITPQGRQSLLLTPPSFGYRTPNAKISKNCSTPSSGAKQLTPGVQGKWYTPIKEQEQTPNMKPRGFTPVKLPSSLEEMHSWACKTPTLKTSTESEEDIESLLCDEALWSDEEDHRLASKTAVRNERTPSRAVPSAQVYTPPNLGRTRHRKRSASLSNTDSLTTSKTKKSRSSSKSKKASHPKCKKSLELLFSEGGNVKDSNPGSARISQRNSFNDLDELDVWNGYLLFYNEKVKSLVDADLLLGQTSQGIQQMWWELSQDERDTMIALARTNRDTQSSEDSNLSEDLAALSVQPIASFDLSSSKDKLLSQVAKGEPDPGECWPVSPLFDLGATDEDYLLCRDSPLLSDTDIAMPFAALESEDENLNMTPPSDENEIFASCDLSFLPSSPVSFDFGDVIKPLLILDESFL